MTTVEFPEIMPVLDALVKMYKSNPIRQGQFIETASQDLLLQLEYVATLFVNDIFSYRRADGN